MTPNKTPTYEDIIWGLLCDIQKERNKAYETMTPLEVAKEFARATHDPDNKDLALRAVKIKIEDCKHGLVDMHNSDWWNKVKANINDL